MSVVNRSVGTLFTSSMYHCCFTSCANYCYIIIIITIIIIKRKLTGTMVGYQSGLAIGCTNGFRFPLGKNSHRVHPALGPKQRPLQSVPELLSRIYDG